MVIMTCWAHCLITWIAGSLIFSKCHGARLGRNSGGANVLLDCLARWTRRSTRRKETENPKWASIRLWRTELVPIQPLIQFPQVPSMKLSP